MFDFTTIKKLIYIVLYYRNQNGPNSDLIKEIDTNFCKFLIY